MLLQSNSNNIFRKSTSDININNWQEYKIFVTTVVIRAIKNSIYDDNYDFIICISIIEIIIYVIDIDILDIIIINILNNIY